MIGLRAGFIDALIESGGAGAIAHPANDALTAAPANHDLIVARTI